MAATKRPQKKRKTEPAVDRLRRWCPGGPPYCLLVLDVETCDALRLGAVNSRAMVEADRAFKAVQPLPLPKDYPA